METVTLIWMFHVEDFHQYCLREGSTWAGEDPTEERSDILQYL